VYFNCLEFKMDDPGGYVIEGNHKFVSWNSFATKESVSDRSSARPRKKWRELGKPIAGLPAHKSLSLSYNNYCTESRTCSITQYRSPVSNTKNRNHKLKSSYNKELFYTYFWLLQATKTSMILSSLLWQLH